MLVTFFFVAVRWGSVQSRWSCWRISKVMRARDARFELFRCDPITSPLTFLLCAAALVEVGDGTEHGLPVSIGAARAGDSSTSIIGGIGVLALVVRR